METFLPGLRGMLNWHPVFVHFPIGLWVGALIFEAIAVLRSSEDWHRTAARLLYLGTLCAFAAVGTGLLAEEAVPEASPAHEVMELHEKLMFATTSVAVALCGLAFFKRKDFSAGMRKIFLAGLLVLAALMTLGADRGAQMVYQYGVSVDWSKANPKK